MQIESCLVRVPMQQMFDYTETRSQPKRCADYNICMRTGDEANEENCTRREYIVGDCVCVYQLGFALTRVCAVTFPKR